MTGSVPALFLPAARIHALFPAARVASVCLNLLAAAVVCAGDTESGDKARSAQEQVAAEHELVKQRYVRFLTGTDETFAGQLGAEAGRQFVRRLKGPIASAMAFDFSRDADKTFRAFPGDAGHQQEASIYSPLLERFLLSLAYGYCVRAPGNPHYRHRDVLDCYIRCLEYLHGRGVREGMTFHNNENRMHMDGAPQPPPGAANLAHMELRMGAFCQSVLLMEPYLKQTQAFDNARALVRHLEMLGRTSGHVRYYEPYTNPTAFKYRVQSDAIQNYSDTTLVSALLETDKARRHDLLLEAQRVFSDSLQVIPGWADTIKPDFTGFHHRGIYGNAYTGGFLPQAAFGIHVLRGTTYAVDPRSVENLKNLILTYRLYCQKFAMPFGIRGRMPLATDHLRTTVFTGVLIYASELGLNDATMKRVFARLWEPDQVGLDFLFVGGRGKAFRGLYPLEMLDELNAAAPPAEPDPSGFWYKPYGGLALHRRDNWMVAVKGYSKYVWDYEGGEDRENVYGQYLSHGMLTIFARGEPVTDVDSGYRLDRGWDWYRMPATTAVHFPIRPGTSLEHRRFSPETFLGAVSCDGRNGAWGMKLNQPTFADGTHIDLRARKSAFFVDDLIVMLGTGIAGGDGVHAVETTLFQSFLDQPHEFRSAPSTRLIDPAGNGYYVPDDSSLKVFQGEQDSYGHDGVTRTRGDYAVAWFDHGTSPRDASYQFAVLVRGARTIPQLAATPENYYRVVNQTDALHHVDFPAHRMSGLVFFEPAESDHPVMARASDPCLVMCRQLADDRIRVGVANPDLGLLPPDAPSPTFRFVSENEHQYLPSRPRQVQLALHGHWHIRAPTEGVTIVSSSMNQTAVRFNGLHGMSVQVELVRD